MEGGKLMLKLVNDKQTANKTSLQFASWEFRSQNKKKATECTTLTQSVVGKLLHKSTEITSLKIILKK